MKLRTISSLLVMIVVLGLTSTCALGEETDKPAKNEPTKVSVTADDTKVVEVIESLAKQSKEKILVESSVKGTVKLQLTDVSLESALTTLCKTAKLQWRKVFISPKSSLLEQPDKFAATVRLMSGMSFPDMVLAGSSLNKVGVHFEEEQAVKSSEESAVNKLGLSPVYLITNDGAIAAKAAKEEKDKQKSAIDEYTDLAKKGMDMFMKMSPEEQEQAIIAGINMMDQIDPNYMAMATKAMMNADPETWQRLQRRSSEMIFNMSTDDRREFLKMSTQLQKNMFTQEQMQILKEDMEAVMKEINAEQGGAEQPQK